MAFWVWIEEWQWKQLYEGKLSKLRQHCISIRKNAMRGLFAFKELRMHNGQNIVASQILTTNINPHFQEMCFHKMAAGKKLNCISRNCPGESVGWLVRPSLRLSDFHCVGVCGPIQSVRRPRYVNGMTHMFSESYDQQLSDFNCKMYFYKVYLSNIICPKCIPHLLSFASL